MHDGSVGSKEMVRRSLVSLFGEHCPASQIDRLVEAVRLHPFALPPAWVERLGQADSPLWRQCVPDVRELEDDDTNTSSDPLEEARHAVLPGAIHRYQDRLLVFVSARCAGYCRFCTRRRMVGRGGPSSRQGEGASGPEDVHHDPWAVPAKRADVIAWLRKHPEVRDVLLSGGDPLILSDDQLEDWVRDLRGVSSVAVLRVGTRMPSFDPQRITPQLSRRLAAYAPLYFNVHFNHPDELTAEAMAACRRLSSAGIIVGNQTVLLAGINDSVETLRELFYALLSCGVRPYYLHTMDQVVGTAHFRVPLERAAAIWEELALTTSGMAVPRMMIDLPHGGGKIQYMRGMLVRDAGQGQLIFRNTDGGLTEYSEKFSGGSE